jgi:hypothetical protein
MKFVTRVRRQEIPWPTQKLFNREKWRKEAEQFGEDAKDSELLSTGLWVADTLEEIRQEVRSSRVWHLSLKQRARYLLTLSNYDYRLLQEKLDEARQGPYVVPTVALEEVAYDAIDQTLWGSKRISDLLDSQIDSIDLCLQFSGEAEGEKPVKAEQVFAEFRKIVALGTMYQTAEDVFHYTLWLDWKIEDQDKFWAFIPSEPYSEKLWGASYRRFYELQSQLSMWAAVFWQRNKSVRALWIMENGGSPTFKLEKEGKLVKVSREGLDTNIDGRVPPAGFLYRTIASESYYTPLIEQPLESLGNKSILDLLTVFVSIIEVAESLIDSLPITYHMRDLDKASEIFCPIFLRSSLVKAIAAATNLDRKSVSKLLETITWSKNKESSLYFRPLTAVETKNGLGLILALWPLMAVNPYRIIDQWLSEFGLPLDKRGELFEDEIKERMNLAKTSFSMKDYVSVEGPIELVAEDGSKEEFDTLLLLHTTVVIGEAKCQKLPITPVERANYLKTLEEASLQVLRKTEWAKRNLSVIAGALRVAKDKLTTFVPVVLTNHSPGVGYRFNSVPVIDRILLENYLAKPYSSTGIVQGDKVTELKKPPLYNNLQEFAEKFSDYVSSPYPIQELMDILKPETILLPIRRDKPVVMLQYLVDSKLVPQIPNR